VLSEEDAAPPLDDPATPSFLPWLQRAGGRPVLLAVSGGPDSIAMMHLAAAANPAGGGALHVATVDHGLRDSSRHEAEAVVEQARSLGLAGHLLSWIGPKPVSRIQEAAREARYRLLFAEADRLQAACVMTAHTLDDQAETLLQRLVHGSGLRGLGAIRPERRIGGVSLVRPLLAVTKLALLDLCRARGWPYFSDPSNQDSRYGRVRVRAMMRVLAGEGLTAERLAVVAQRLQRAEDALEQQAKAAEASLFRDEGPGAVAMEAAAFLAQPEEIRVRLLLLAAARVAKSDDGHLRLERAETAQRRIVAAAPGARLRMSFGGALLSVSKGLLVVSREPERRRGRGTGAGQKNDVAIT
jgi:tRNA(Ile)-lysidine synthase